MNICGFEKTTLLDFPGKVACTVFVGGCDFRCPYCYNPELVLCSSRMSCVAEDEFFSFLEKRRSVLDGVVVCGGEPTLQRDLRIFLGKVRELGFLTKLDTNGSRPRVVRELLEAGLLDFVSLDVKAPLNERYCLITGEESSHERTRESIEILLRDNVSFELRTTVVPTLHEKEDLVDLAIQISSLASPSPSPRWILQQFQPGKCLDPKFDKIEPYGSTALEDMLTAVRRYVPTVELRGV
jgi:pyruvate formate lyase activating enzyme